MGVVLRFSDELVVGGVYMSLLIKQTGWVFRKPKAFLVAAMEKLLKLMGNKHDRQNSKQLELLTDALCGTTATLPEAWFVHEKETLALALGGDYDPQVMKFRCANDG